MGHSRKPNSSVPGIGGAACLQSTEFRWGGAGWILSSRFSLGPREGQTECMNPSDPVVCQPSFCLGLGRLYLWEEGGRNGGQIG